MLRFLSTSIKKKKKKKKKKILSQCNYSESTWDDEDIEKKKNIKKGGH
jgi:hypothetical protein